jgi:hypothetical protein
MSVMVFRTASVLSAEVTPRDSLMTMSERDARGPKEHEPLSHDG